MALGSASPDPERAAEAARYTMVLRCVNHGSPSVLACLGRLLPRRGRADRQAPRAPRPARRRAWMRRCPDRVRCRRRAPRPGTPRVRPGPWSRRSRSTGGSRPRACRRCCRARLRVAAAAAGLGELRAELAQQEGARDLEARVEVQRAEHGLEGVGQDRVLGAPALLAFAAAQADQLVETERARARRRARAGSPRRPARALSAPSFASGCAAISSSATTRPSTASPRNSSRSLPWSRSPSSWRARDG